MHTSHDERQLDVTLPSTLNSYQGFIRTTVEGLAELGWGPCDLFGVEMALEETISNAIRHGNKLDLDKKVQVDCRISRDRFWARIADEGAGFNPHSVPDCCAPDRLEVPGGRGLTLICAYMTDVQYNDRGNCVTIEKRLGAANPSSNGCSP